MVRRQPRHRPPDPPVPVRRGHRAAVVRDRGVRGHGDAVLRRGGARGAPAALVARPRPRPVGKRGPAVTVAAEERPARNARAASVDRRPRSARFCALAAYTSTRAWVMPSGSNPWPGFKAILLIVRSACAGG